jgi:hypothetical protein
VDDVGAILVIALLVGKHKVCPYTSTQTPVKGEGGLFISPIHANKHLLLIRDFRIKTTLERS